MISRNLLRAPALPTALIGLVAHGTTATAGDLAHEAAITNYEFLAHEVVTTNLIIKRLKAANK